MGKVFDVGARKAPSPDGGGGVCSHGAGLCVVQPNASGDRANPHRGVVCGGDTAVAKGRAEGRRVPRHMTDPDQHLSLQRLEITLDEQGAFTQRLTCIRKS